VIQAYDLLIYELSAEDNKPVYNVYRRRNEITCNADIAESF